MSTRPGRLRRVLRSAAALAAAGLSGGLLAAAPAQALPAFGDVPLVVLACRFGDAPAPSRTITDIERLVRGPGDSLDARVRALSGNHASLAGVQVRGWFGMALPGSQRPVAARVQQECRSAAAAAGVTVPSTARVLVVVDSGDYRPETTPDATAPVITASQPLSAWQHQLGHALGLRDAWSLDPRTGEYRAGDDEYSLMGGFRRPWPTNVSGRRPTLNAYELDRLSWLDESRIVTAGADGRATTTVDLAPVDTNPQIPVTGPLLVRVPFDRRDPEHYYAVSLRAYNGDIDTPEMFSGSVLVHEVVNGMPVLLRDNSIPDMTTDSETHIRPGRWPLEDVSLNGVTIRTVAGAQNGGVRVVVTTPVTRQCIGSLEPRQAGPGDALVCVTPARVTATAEANRLAPTRWVNGPWGPHTCVSGLVWREAYPGDEVCVTPAERGTVAEENRTAAANRNVARLTAGPNGCAAGYVWREADRTDHVCVSPARRGEVAGERIQGSPCPQYMVSRRAWPGDLVCSSVASRSLVEWENTHAWTRVARP